ncbi:MAG: T9SS type A sorting domain-containing protein, partial [Ichthyobacteriaceae bacterium]|nr:T9SS type A sorting domain-containing protein [Ichthyobacteriaceae bacterium]
WISGEESSADIPFTDVEQQKISTYLNNGGKFIVSGAEIGYQLVGKSKGVDFFTNYLKAEYKSDGGKSVGTALGIENTIYENYDIAFNNANNWEITSPDGVTAVAGAENLMTYSNGGGENAAVGYKGTFGNGIKEGGVVFYSFPIGSAKLESAKNLVLLSTKYLFNYESILSVESNNTLSTLKTYPNPFVEELYITINNIANTTVNVQVYNAVGLIIKSEKIEVLNSNVIKLYAGNLAKGLYFIKVTNSEGKVGVSKIIKE